jgi:hypothetical protein
MVIVFDTQIDTRKEDNLIPTGMGYKVFFIKLKLIIFVFFFLNFYISV